MDLPSRRTQKKHSNLNFEGSPRCQDFNQTYSDRAASLGQLGFLSIQHLDFVYLDHV